MGRRSLSELRQLVQLAQLAGRTRALAITLAAVVLVGSGCLRLGVPAPRPPPASVAEGRLPRLADVFYQRIANRRFNSIATFHDPALREFFGSPEAFADYYADLAQALNMARFEANRPLRIVLLEYEPNDVDRILIHVHFSGDNARPLRWWDSRLMRADQWERRDDRWIIVPGKL
jgi:hypothetical protein